MGMLVVPFVHFDQATIIALLPPDFPGSLKVNFWDWSMFGLNVYRITFEVPWGTAEVHLPFRANKAELDAGEIREAFAAGCEALKRTKP